MSTHLYLARMRVEPDSGHPLFHKIDTAVIVLCLFADDDEDAVKRAEAFPPVSRWELLEVERLEPVSEKEPGFSALIAAAKRAGIAWHVVSSDGRTDLLCLPPEAFEEAPAAP
jgi:hypothetical protein